MLDFIRRKFVELGVDLQERDAVAGIVGYKSVPAGCGKSGWVTPGVIIDSVEIAALIISTAIQVFSHKLLVCVDVCSAVANWNLAVASVTNVLLHISSDRLHVRSSIRVACIIDDFVS